MKKLLTILTVITITSQIAMANQIYSTQKLGNGQVINKCRYSNGRIDYCTQEDAFRAMDSLNNPQKYMSKSELANLNSMTARVDKELPLKQELYLKQQTLKKELTDLQNKQNVGVDVDKTKMSTLSYKIGIVDSLINYGPFPLKDGTLSSTTSSLAWDYEKLFNALDSKAITQTEFNEAKSKLKTKEQILRNIYNKGMALTTIPQKQPCYWVTENYPGSKDYEYAQNPLNQTHEVLNSVPLNVTDKVPTKVKSKFDTLKNIKDTVQNTGLF